MKRHALYSCILAAALAAAAAGRASAAAVQFRDFQIQGCRGANAYTNFFDGSGNPIIHTAQPDFFVWMTTNAAVTLVNTAGGGNWPYPSATALSGVQHLWNFDTAVPTGVGNATDYDQAASAHNLTYSNGGGGQGDCSHRSQTNAQAGLFQSFQPSTGTATARSSNHCRASFNAGTGLPFQTMSNFTVEAWVKINGKGCKTGVGGGGFGGGTGGGSGPDGKCNNGDWPILIQCPSAGNNTCMHMILRSESGGACNGGAPVGTYTPYFAFYNNDVCGGNVPTDGQWHHLAFVWNGSAQAIYLDGNLVSGGHLGTANGAYTGGPATTFIGTGGSSPAENDIYANGWIDGVRVWNIQLTQGTVAAHALGQFFSIDGSTTMFRGGTGGNMAKLAGNTINATSLINSGTSLLWAFPYDETFGVPTIPTHQFTAPGNNISNTGTRNIIPTKGGADSTIGFQFTEEDNTEAIAPAALVSVLVRQTTMSTPPNPMFTPLNQTSASWGSPSWFCDPFPYTGQPAPQTPNANVQYTYSLTNVSQGGTIPFTPVTPSAVTYHDLNPNARYQLTATVKYTDTGGNNNIIGPSAATIGVSTATFAWPPSAPTGLTVLGGTSLSMTLHLTAAPMDTQACNLDGTGSSNPAACPNPTYTSTEVLGSVDNGATYVTELPFTAAGSQTPVATINGLNKSSKYLFKERNENLDGVVTAASAATPNPGLHSPGITQPRTPVSITGDSSPGRVVCPKTDIQWNWSAVPIGSAQNPLPSGLLTEYMLSDFSGPFKGSTPNCAGCVLNNTTFYIQGGQGTGSALTPGTQYFASVKAYDDGAPNTPASSATDIRFSGASGFAAANTAPPDVFAPTNIVPTSLVGQVQWTWNAPPNLCAPAEYHVIDQHSGIDLTPSPTLRTPAPVVTFFQTPLGANAQASISVYALDAFATSPLSAAATGYAQAFPPQSAALVGVSTGGVVLTWNANTNPNYTRYEVSMATADLDVPMGALISTPIAIGDNFTGTAAGFTGLNPGTTYFFRVRAVNGKAGDNFGGLFTSYSRTSGMTLWNPPTVTGAALSKTSIQWQWPSVAGVSAYKATLVETGGQTTFLPPYGVTITSAPTNLSTNTRYNLQVTAINGQGLGNAAAPVPVYTLADSIAVLPIVGVTTNSITYAWNPNTNPAGTFYEVDVATNAGVSPVVAVVTPGSPGVTVTGLFPGTTYFGQVRAFNGDLIPVNPYVQFASTRTNLDPTITLTSAPLTVYSIPQGAVGLWHFDESSGTVASDSSTFANSGRLTCLYNACVSTPTWTAGPVGLGSAANLQGLTSSFVQIPNAAQYNFSTALTVEAWVKPATTAQPNGAGIVVKGPFNGEDFYLDVSGGKYRFSACPGAGPSAPNAATANASIAAGEWTHIAGVFNGTVNTLFVNGVASPNVSAACARNGVISSQPIGVGSRKSGTGAFDLGFQGAIDEVRLINGLESAAQVQADYASSLTSTITMVGAAAGLQLALPPNAFGGPATIYATADPLNHPLRVSVPELLLALANPPTGQTLITGMLFEIVPTVNGTQFTSPLGSTATVILSYRDSNDDGIIDDTNPPIAAATLRMFTLDTTLAQWTQLPTTLDKAGRTLRGLTPHFSVFAAFGASTTGANASQARVYPNPWKIGSNGRFDAAALTFDTLPSQGFIRIFNLAGMKVAELHFTPGNAGSATWNGLNAAGRSAASGVYFAYIKSEADDSSRILKFAIER